MSFAPKVSPAVPLFTLVPRTVSVYAPFMFSVPLSIFANT
jgi:hypothetical protein